MKAVCVYVKQDFKPDLLTSFKVSYRIINEEDRGPIVITFNFEFQRTD